MAPLPTGFIEKLRRIKSNGSALTSGFVVPGRCLLANPQRKLWGRSSFPPSRERRRDTLPPHSLRCGLEDLAQRKPQRGEFRVAAVVAGFLDEGGGFFEVLLRVVTAGHGEVVVGEVELHEGPAGDAVDFREVGVGGAGEEGEGEIVRPARAAEGVDSLDQVTSGLGRAGRVRAAE